jgi:hypothetical protein
MLDSSGELYGEEANGSGRRGYDVMTSATLYCRPGNKLTWHIPSGVMSLFLVISEVYLELGEFKLCHRNKKVYEIEITHAQ